MAGVCCFCTDVDPLRWAHDLKINGNPFRSFPRETSLSSPLLFLSLSVSTFSFLFPWCPGYPCRLGFGGKFTPYFAQWIPTPGRTSLAIKRSLSGFVSETLCDLIAFSVCIVQFVEKWCVLSFLNGTSWNWMFRFNSLGFVRFNWRYFSIVRVNGVFSASRNIFEFLKYAGKVRASLILFIVNHTYTWLRLCVFAGLITILLIPRMSQTCDSWSWTWERAINPLKRHL